MVDFKSGVSVIKSCDLKISPLTTRADIQKLAAQYIKEVTEVDTGYKHTCLVCNENLNFEECNDIWICSYGDGKIISIDVHPNGFDVRNQAGRMQAASCCRRWLEVQGQRKDFQRYDWGSVSFVDDDRSWFLGIRIVFGR